MPDRPELLELLPHHLEQLIQGSGIAPEVIAERGYRSILSPGGYSELKPYGFTRVQANLPGLLLPLWTTDGKNGLMVYRPDAPRLGRDGKVIKYELPKGTRVRLDCPLRCQPLLADPAIPLWIAEGQKKADALATRGLCAIALLGVWNFKGRNPFGGTTLLADFDYISLNSREVRIVFDSDVMTKPQVRQALDRLTEHLQRKGAHVATVYLPQEGSHKIGVDDYLLTHSAGDLEGLVDAPRPQPKVAPPIVELLPHGPKRMTRPLMLIDGRAYAATWLWTKTTITERLNKNGEVIRLTTPEVTEQRQMFVIRDDGVLFGTVQDPKATPLAELGLTVHLAEIPADDKLWSAKGVTAYRLGHRPDPPDVFRRLVAVIDTFLDFARSLTSQETMCELVACYLLATYFLDAFSVIGYLWPNGDKGSGKTTLLLTVGELAYLGQVILAGGSYAALRDLADYGATLAFDDAEHVMDLKRGDPDKRALLLAGNRRGSSVPVKELGADRTWRTRYVNTFCPRLFSAIRLPDDVLASRTITMPLVRSADYDRMNRDPTDYETWPHERRTLLDDLWALALANLAAMRQYDLEAAHQAPLSGRPLEPWRAILAVALWLQQAHSTDGLYDRMTALAQSYQRERHDLEAEDPTRLLILALQALAADNAYDVVTFSASEFTTVLNDIAAKEELADETHPFTTSRRVGHLLKRLRLGTAERSAHQRIWKVKKAEITNITHTYSLTPCAETSSMS